MFFTSLFFDLAVLSSLHFVTKVCGLYVVTVLNWTPIFEWFMARLVIKKAHQNDICYDAIGLCGQHVDIILVSTMNTIGGTCRITQRKRIFSFTSCNFYISTLILEL